MLKGVNKQILEITNTDSPYFERIIFFVRPSSSGMEEGLLRKEAEKISTSTTTKPPKAKINTKLVLTILAYSVLSAGAGIALSFVLNRILGGLL